MKAQTVPDTRGLVPAIHVFQVKKDVDARHRRQVYAVCARQTLRPGMTSEMPKPDFE